MVMRIEERIRRLEQKLGLDKSIETDVVTLLYGCDESHGPQLEAEGCVREGDSWVRDVEPSEKWAKRQEAKGRRIRTRIMYRINTPSTETEDIVEKAQTKKLSSLVKNRSAVAG